ncbi:MAG: hypothetical protein PVI71_07645 [Desulfobacterales bacterium]|jgi:hypothetical protein
MTHDDLRKLKNPRPSKSVRKSPIRSAVFVFWGLMVGVLMSLSLFISCSGGGLSGLVDALSLPARITMTQLGGAGGTSANTVANASGVGAAAYDDPGSDYSEEPKETWVEDTDTLDLINDILGVVQDSAYDQFLNAGPYKALVRKVDDSVETQTGSSSTSSTTEDLMEITVDVTRADNNSPMIIKVWVDETGEEPGEPSQRIRGYFEVFEGVSGAYPLGRMEAHFKANLLDENGDELPGAPVFTMALKVDADESGNVVVESVDIGDIDPPGPEEENWNNQLNLIANADLSVGKAYFKDYEYWTDGVGVEEDDNEGYIAFNADFFKEKEGLDPEEVFDKDNLFRKVFRYKLFESDTGNKVEMNSGFPIRLENGYYGYIGYYGLWVENDVEVLDGDTVTDLDGNTYEVFQVGGKLRKHTKSSITLGELADLEMSYYECGEGGNPCTDYVIVWDGTTQEFLTLGERNFQTGMIDYYAEPVSFVFAEEWHGAWCQTLNAYLNLGRYPAPNNGTVITYHTEEIIDPSIAENLTLYYWGPPLGVAPEDYWAGVAAEKTYTFDALDLILYDESVQPILDIASETGTTISPLTIVSLPQEDMWTAYDQDTYYSWTTGPDDWQQFTTVIDSGQNFITFDPPLNFAYVHSIANDLNGDATYDGQKFSLEYDGFELRVPWYYDSEEEEWQPQINLKDGTTLDHDGTQYVVKGTEIGVMMQLAANPGDAAGLIIDETIPAPTLVYDPAKTGQVGAPPVAEVKVIKGEVLN